MANPNESRIEPCAELRPWVSEFRVARSQPGQIYELAHLPTGEAGLMFRATGEGSGDLCAMGPLRRARYKTVYAVPFYVRVRLHPGRARRVLGLPLHELADQIVPLESVWNSSGKFLCEQLVEAGPDRAVPLLEEALSRFIRRQKADPGHLVSRVVQAMDADPCAPVNEHARSMGLSNRQLRHLFRVELGIGPKHYARIARLLRLLSAAPARTTLADLALDAGFYDQAHMIADFHDLLNATPTAFLARQSLRSSALTISKSAHSLE